MIIRNGSEIYNAKVDMKKVLKIISKKKETNSKDSKEHKCAQRTIGSFEKESTIFLLFANSISQRDEFINKFRICSNLSFSLCVCI